ncbi:Alkanesulfonate monooxygenase [Fimbriiglobus ruber]|uniref:Alkanesulfonate monooxygenase n=1 Tax=Fimbriiglobus ruber TaxID=1908690 RepID=A0A225DPE7_9BACT|nr:hypothetical protein [Fimbriiglobus ruber]OWK39079.1 Alkanesulfonate monooxygenase [Fimbriiglobus ruber]
MVGDGPTVAALMREYAAHGIDTFILSGYPHLDEAYRVAEHVFPLLPRGDTPEPRPARAIVGEVVANGAVAVPAGAKG